MMEPDFKRKGKDRQPWKDTEKRLASRLGGKRHGMSGAHYTLKGDLSTKSLLVESKSTEKASISVKQAWLEKVDAEAMAQQKVPALAVTFQNMNKRTDKDWIMVPIRFFENLMKDVK